MRIIAYLPNIPSGDGPPIGLTIGEGIVGQNGTLGIEQIRFRCPTDVTEGERYALAVFPANAANSASEDALATTVFTVSATPPRAIAERVAMLRRDRPVYCRSLPGLLAL